MISVPGIGSGLDIDNIVSGLVAAEGDAKTLLLANRRSDVELDISAFGGLKNILSNSLSPSLDFLKRPANYEANTLTTSAPEVFTPTTATGSIAPGIFNVEVRALADAQKLMTTGFTNQDTAVGTGTLTITVGNDSFNVTIDGNNNTLAGIRAAINDATDNTGVSATIINVDDGGGGTEAKLVLSSDDTGTDNTITVTVDDDDLNDTDASGLSAFYYDTGDATTPERLTQINAASNAEVYIDGQRVLSSSNTVTDAIQGVTITVLKEDTGNVHELSVSSDSATVKSNIESFVTNYNTLITYINDVTFFDPAQNDAGTLLGDSLLRTFNNQLRLKVNESVSGLNGQYTTLVDIGITTNDDGTLTINNNTLDTAVNNNLSDVADLFSSTNGVGVKLDSLVFEYTRTNGLLDNKTEGLNRTVTNINEDLIDLEQQLASLEERLLRQFNSLDLLVTRLNSTSSFLTQQFDILGNIFNQTRS